MQTGVPVSFSLHPTCDTRKQSVVLPVELGLLCDHSMNPSGSVDADRQCSLRRDGRRSDLRDTGSVPPGHDCRRRQRVRIIQGGHPRVGPRSYEAGVVWVEGEAGDDPCGAGSCKRVCI